VLPTYNGDLLADSYNILNRWLLNTHNTNDVRQIEMHASEPLVSEHSSFEVEIAIEKLERYVTRY
jgi:hypothetical protein